MGILMVILAILVVFSACTMWVRSAGLHALLAVCFFVVALLGFLEWIGRLHI